MIYYRSRRGGHGIIIRTCVVDRRAKYIIEEDLMTREKSTVDKSVQPRGRERERSRLPACLIIIIYNIRRRRRRACLPFGGQNKEQ